MNRSNIGNEHWKRRRVVTLLLTALLAVGCGHEEQRLRSEVKELKVELDDVRQRSNDLKVRMQHIRARNKVLIGLVEGMTSDPEHAGHDDGGPMATAHRALAALDHDLEILAVTVQQSRKDIVELRSQRSSLKSSLTEAMHTIEDARRREQQAHTRVDTFRKMLLQLRSLIEEEQLELQVVRNQMVIQLPEAVLFDTGRDKLKEEGKTVLANLATALQSIKGREFQIAGHTDNIPIYNWRFKSNWHLSAARAVAVTRFLVKQGVDAHRLSASGYGDTRPLVAYPSDEEKQSDRKAYKEKAEAARQANRRIEIALLPALDELPDLSSLDEDAQKPATHPHDDDDGAEAAEPEAEGEAKGEVKSAATEAAATPKPDAKPQLEDKPKEPAAASDPPAKTPEKAPEKKAAKPEAAEKTAEQASEPPTPKAKN